MKFIFHSSTRQDMSQSCSAERRKISLSRCSDVGI